MVQALRLAIESNEYRAILNAGEELSEQDKSRKGFIRKLCLVRWKEVHLYNYLNDSVLLTIGRDELGVDGDYPDVILRINREIKNSSFNKKPALHLETQKLSGALGIEDFCGTKNTPHVRNIQHFKNNKGESLRISYVRHGTPTALEGRVNTARQVAAPFGRFLGLDMDGGEEVTSDYREYLRALEDEGESELFCVHQRRTPNVIENERSRVKKIEALQEQHPNLFVLTQPVEGDLFEHKGDYSQISSFEDLKMSLREEFFERDLEDPQTRAALPCCLRNNEEYKLAFNQLLKDVQELFFPNKEFAIAPNMMDSLANVQKELEKKQFEAIKVFLLEHSTDDLQNQEEPKSTVEIDVRVLERLLQDNDLNDHFGENISVENLQQRIYLAAKSVKKLEKTEDLESENLKTWQSYILLFYIFQKMDLKFRLNGVNGFSLTAYTTPCKDFLDRGGNQAFVERRLLDYMMGMGNDEERKEEALINLLGPPILVKKKEAIERRIKPGLEVEKLLASMDQERITKLVNYTFGDEKWRIVEIATPKLKAQTGMPLLSRHIKNEITNIQPNEVVACIRKYAHYDLDQWERVCVREIQGKGLEIGSNSINVLTRSQRNRNPKDIRALKGQVLEHKLVNHDEPKAEKILSSLSQCFNIVHDSISETFNEAITANVLAVVNQQTEGTFLVDLSRDDVISIRYTDPSFVLKRQDQEEIIATCEAEVEIQYRKGEEPEGYMHWTLKPID